MDTENFVVHTLRADGFDASEDGTGRGTPLGPAAYPFIVNAAESCAKESHARHSEVSRCLDQTGGFASSQGGTVVAVDFRNEAVDGDVTHTLQAVADPNPNKIPHVFNILGGAHRGQSHAYETEVSGCLQTKGLKTTGNEAGTLVQEQKLGVRRLTPLEAERLQGFPDSWTLVPYRGKPAADGPRYKALGNSMAVPCMAWIGRRIKAVEEAIH